MSSQLQQYQRTEPGTSHVMQGFIKNGGQRSLSYDASNVATVAGGDTLEELEVRPCSIISQHSIDLGNRHVLL